MRISNNKILSKLLEIYYWRNKDQNYDRSWKFKDISYEEISNETIDSIYE